jgi:hypothetical protein
VLSGGEAARLGESEAQVRIFSAIEGYILENADQWCIFRRFWEDAA